MARIQQYQSQISTQTGAPSPMSSPADFGAQQEYLSKSFDRTGEAIERAVSTIEAKRERDADLWRAQVVAEESVTLTKAIQESKISSEPGAPDLAEKFSQETKARMDEILKLAPTDASKAKIQAQLTGLYGGVVQDAVVFQAKASAAQSVEKVKGVLNSWENNVYLNPGAYGKALEETNSLIDSQTVGYKDPTTGSVRAYGLTKQAADELKTAQQGSFASKSFEGRVDRAKTIGEVNGILGEIKGEEWQKIIPPQQYERLITNATKAGEQIAYKNDMLALSDFNTRIDAASRGLPVAAPNLSAVSDPVVRAQKAKEWNSAVNYGRTVKEIETASPAQLDALYTRLSAQARGGSPESMVAADRALDVVERKRSAVAASNVGVAVDVAATGNKIDEAAARENIAKMTDPIARDRAEKALAGAVKSGEFVRDAKTMPADQVPGTLSNLAAQASETSDPEAQKAAIENLNVFNRALAQRNKEIENDSAGYVMRSVPQVGQAYKAYRDAEAGVKPGDEASMMKANVARQEYITETIAAQTRLGVPMGQVNLLSNDGLAQVKATIDSTDRTPEGAEKAYRALVDTYGVYGKDYGNMVYRQLVDNKIITGVDVVVARMSDQDQQSTGIDLKKAAAIGEKELLKLTPSEEKVKAEVDREVTAAMAPLFKTLSRNVGGVNAATQTADAARLLAIYSVATKGMTVQDAVKAATGKIAMEKYNFVGSYRVPVRDHASGAVLNHYDISAGASQILRNVEKLDVALPRSLAGLKGEGHRTNAMESLRSYGSWVTSPNEDGVDLRWQNGEAVTKNPVSWAKQYEEFKAKPWEKTALNAEDEKKFRGWLAATPWYSEVSGKIAAENGMEKSQLDQNRVIDMLTGDKTDYDYRGAWKANARTSASQHDSGLQHWPSADATGRMLKSPQHGTAWKEFFMRQYQRDPDDLGLKDMQAAQAWSLKQQQPPVRFTWKQLMDASAYRADEVVSPVVGGP
jgi:hypothetical protein